MYLHFGQNRGKSSNTVCGRICVRVFPPQRGQQSQFVFPDVFSVITCTSVYFPISARNAASRSKLPLAKPGISLMDLQMLMLTPVSICPIS